MFNTDPSGTRRLPTLLLILALLGGGLVACAQEDERPSPALPPVPPAALAGVLAAVRDAPAIRALPAALTPSLANASADIGFDHDRCEVPPAGDRIDPCVLGDPASSTKVVLYGDSHAGTWLPALTEIAQRRHWQVRFFGKPACPTLQLTFWNQQEARYFTECDRFRAYVEHQVKAQRPDLLLVTNESFSQKSAPGTLITPHQWQLGLARTLSTLRRSARHVVVIGDIPVLDQSGPQCLAAHRNDVQACSTTQAVATRRVWNRADQAAADATGSGYISVLPWLCTAVCTPVIGNYLVYRNRFHLSATYSKALNGVLEEALVKYLPTAAAP